MSQPKTYDLVIVGGAMAGASLALALCQLTNSANKTPKIALVEAFEPSTKHPGFDARAIALAAATLAQLKRWGLWSSLSSLGTPIEHIEVSDRGHAGTCRLHAEDYHQSELGHVVELEAVGQVLHTLLSKADVDLYCPDSVQSVDSTVDNHTLTLSSGQQLQCALLVGADGLNSVVRQSLKIPLTQKDFGQAAVIANIRCDKPSNGWAFERFSEFGPIALLPMSDERMSLVWAMEESQQAEILALEDDAFIARLQQAFGYRLGNITQTGARSGYPLKLSFIERPIHHRCVLVGNAAQTLHPIAGQGFNLGLRDVAALVTCIDKAWQQSQDLGSVAVTHDYLQSRASDRSQTITSIEALVRGFSNSHWPMVAGRNVALHLLNAISPLKTPIAQRAMGFHQALD
ncbi:2-octaprenyl-6-methoxyphenyl hydroxylase [Paraferrimonas sedimenticola]|uniref:2-octaprenyl-6-methoxyphenyl hydroxylase n=1 Tax=Paraferrimonas sedimenticola TaxID=375674 RepID=A0AA37VU84_9GAMM|nr:2-octaprenyl-6-methoxyphenyl hydroxylase [Paraferrimonas sedimenticola]GLP95516.1 2-octaprenyl-6-methoxyphenyl hydroxylase [Paraferrimonas sedimenticola]